MWVAAARRIAVLFAGSCAIVVVVSTVLGLLLGSSLDRAVSLGFYLAGSFLLVAGFFFGNRGPIRLRGEPGDEGPWGLGRKRGVRTATPDERRDAVSTSIVFVTLGLALVVVGVVVDGRHTLL